MVFLYILNIYIYMYFKYIMLDVDKYEKNTTGRERL